MNPNQSHYLCAALIQQTQLILANNASALGNSLPVTIYRKMPQTSDPSPPHIWFESQETGSPDELEILGNTVGQDSSGNQLFGAVLWGPMVNFGLRCRAPAERDDIFDKLYQAFSGMGINAATGNRWIRDINTNVGIIVADVTNEHFATTETTGFGQLYEATGSLVISTVAADSITQQTITAVDINPVSVVVYIPAN
jgi:hypothetical protein